MPTPNLPSGVVDFDAANIVQENIHRNFKHNFKKGNSFTLKLNGTGLSEYNKTTQNIQWVIQNAIDKNVRLRAMGSNWALSTVASSDSMINTNALNLRFSITRSLVTDQYIQSGKSEADVLLLQCGNMIWSLNQLIETKLNPRRSLKASGGSNGQTIAGATSTGTHGGALYTGAVHDAIVGLHIVTGPNSHVWLEKASNPVVSDSLINKLGATHIKDDDMFNSAVVSFGSFGVIHGVLLETDPIYLLEEHQFKNIRYTDELKDAIKNLNFNDLRNILPTLPVETPNNSLYHFEMLFNLNKLYSNTGEGIRIQAFYKQPCPSNYKAVHDYTKSAAQYSHDTLGLVARVLDHFNGSIIQKPLITKMVNALFEQGVRPATDSPKTIGETFSYTRFRGEVSSAAMAVDTKDAFRVLDIIFEVNKTNPLPGAVAFRFVKGTQAVLGFTKFDNTCVIEMDGIDGTSARNFFESVWLAVESHAIPYTLHWGKFNFILTPTRVRNMYSDNNVNKWLECRKKLLPKAARQVFTNEFMIQCGLNNVEMIDNNRPDIT